MDKEKELISGLDIWMEIGKLYAKLGEKLYELDRLLKKPKKNNQIS